MHHPRMHPMGSNLGGKLFALSESKCMASVNGLRSAAAARLSGTRGLIPDLSSASSTVMGALTDSRSVLWTR